LQQQASTTLHMQASSACAAHTVTC
jgi:hypothetical protein